MNYSIRYQELAAQFRMGEEVALKNSDIAIRFFPFQSRSIKGFCESVLSNTIMGDAVGENEQFEYPVFVHSKAIKYKDVIVLMHGLNERSWSKYLPWAEYLCQATGKAVVLFPIAYHVNRSPVTWSNPRFLQKIIDFRRKLNGQDRSLSFANVALSERLTDSPHRFYNSGRQSYYDLVQLIEGIQRGKHPLFAKDTRVDVFAYSIGAFLSQILFLSNSTNLLSDAKLFMFCGGNIFSSMMGESRTIMDKTSYERLFEYYQTGFWAEEKLINTGDTVLKAFYSMLAPENTKEQRVGVFDGMKERIHGISLLHDKVMPYAGVVAAIGEDCASKNIEVYDFPYDYTHENPFPVNANSQADVINSSFQLVFEKAANFLSS